MFTLCVLHFKHWSTFVNYIKGWITCHYWSESSRSLERELNSGFFTDITTFCKSTFASNFGSLALIENQKTNRSNMFPIKYFDRITNTMTYHQVNLLSITSLPTCTKIQILFRQFFIYSLIAHRKSCLILNDKKVLLNPLI